jgi:hypothetical protein
MLHVAKAGEKSGFSTVGICFLVGGHFTKNAVWKGVLSLGQNTKICFDVNDKGLACLKRLCAILCQNLTVTYLVDCLERRRFYL